MTQSPQSPSANPVEPPPLANLRAGLMCLSPWMAGLVAALFGAIGAVAHAPLHAWPLLIGAFTGLVWLLDRSAELPRPRRSAFFRVWCFGVGYFLMSTWWTANAFLSFGRELIAFLWLPLIVLPAGLALIWAVAASVAMRYWTPDWRRVLTLTLAFLLAELFRGHAFGGFPWNLPGTVWQPGGPLSQSVAVFGPYTLTGMTLLAAMAPATLGGPDKRAFDRLVLPVIGLSILAAMFAYGFARLAAAPGIYEQPSAGPRLRVVQVNATSQERLENPSIVAQRFVDQSISQGVETRTHIIWPEAAIPGAVLGDGSYQIILEAMARSLSQEQVLIAGVVRRTPAGANTIANYNSLVWFAPLEGTQRLARPAYTPSRVVYDKARLVPFGETLPLAGLLQRSGIRLPLDFTSGMFTPGTGPETFAIPNAPPVSPQICYETIFTGFTPRGGASLWSPISRAMKDRTRVEASAGIISHDRPGWIINASLDAWYGRSTGPAQHLTMARYRALEEGLPVVRAATGGVSAIIDPYGRIVDSLPMGTTGVVDADLPAALPPTPYARLGAFWWLILTVALFWWRVRVRTQRDFSERRLGPR